MQALWNNPIFFKARLLEAREYSRCKSSFWVKQMGLVWCVLVPLAWVLLMTFPEIMDAFAPEYNPGKLFLALGHLTTNWLYALTLSYYVGTMVAIGLALNSTSSLVTGEREKKTYDSLQSTMLSATEILSGRLLTGLYPVVRELLIVTPLGLALGTLAGFGVNSFLCIALLYSTVAFYGMVGLWSSYASKSTQNANRLATGVAGSLLIGIPILSMFMGGNEFLLHLHPIFATGYLSSEGWGPVVLVTAFHFTGAALLWLDALRRERSAVRV